MPIDFEKLMKEGFVNKKIDEVKEVRTSLISKNDFGQKEDAPKESKDKKVTKKKSKRSNPQPKLNMNSDDTVLSVRMIIDTKPSKKTVIDYIKSKIEMFEDTESEDD
jgi:hypothetical protein